jgi:hypothetical protein
MIRVHHRGTEATEKRIEELGDLGIEEFRN